MVGRTEAARRLNERGVDEGWLGSDSHCRSERETGAKKKRKTPPPPFFVYFFFDLCRWVLCEKKKKKYLAFV